MGRVASMMFMTSSHDPAPALPCLQSMACVCDKGGCFV